MIEQFLQTALEFFKEIWFQLDSRFDLQNTEVFKFLKPYLTQAQDNPLYMGIAVAALFLVPYALIKARSISRERERKLDELMEEMEEDEEYDEDDPRRLRRPDTEEGEEADDSAAKPLFGDEKDTSPSYMKVLDEMEGRTTPDEEDSEDDIEEFEIEAEDEETAEPISSQLTDSDFEKDLNEFMSDDLDMEKDIAEEFRLDDSNHDQAIKELQEDGELMELTESPAGEDPFENYSDLDEDEQDKAIKDLQDEMERTINKLTEQIEEPAEPPSPIKDLSELHIGGDTTIDEEYSPEEEFFLEDPQKAETASPDIQSEAPSEESPPISELSDSEVLASMEPELEGELDIESMLAPESEAKPETEPDAEPIAIPDTRDYEPALSGFTFEEESELPSEEPEVSGFSFEAEPEISAEETAPAPSADDFRFEPDVSTESLSFEAESMELADIPEPELKPTRPPLTDDYSAPETTDSLIDRLKFLQSRFENRYQPVERPAEPVEKNIPTKEKDYSASFTEPRRYSSAPAGLPPDSKKYMDLLESFIFMKGQKRHK